MVDEFLQDITEFEWDNFNVEKIIKKHKGDPSESIIVKDVLSRTHRKRTKIFP